MKRVYGNLRRVWKDSKPETFNKVTRIVCIDYQEDTRCDDEGQEVKGWSGFDVQIDEVIDYGHIQSQLVEAAYPPKDEFGKLQNAVCEIVSIMKGTKKIGDSEDVEEFAVFAEFRELCAIAAKEVINMY